MVVESGKKQEGKTAKSGASRWAVLMRAILLSLLDFVKAGEGVVSR